MTRLFATVGTVALLASGATFAQTQTTDHQTNLDQLVQTLQTEFTQLGVDIDPEQLTMSEVRQAYLIVSNDTMDENNRIDQLELLAEQGMDSGTMVAQTTAEPMTQDQGELSVIVEQLQTEFTQLGVEIDPDSLTEDQARQAYLIVSNDSLTEDEQKQQIELLQQQ